MAAPREELKVVAHLDNRRLIKGFIEDGPDAVHVRQRSAHIVPPDRVRVRRDGTNESVDIRLDEIKALFFVKTFDGSRTYSEVKFFTAHPDVPGLWVRLKFKDNEVTEGVVFNSLHFLVNTGFFLKPPDPGSNNELVYVHKRSLLDFKILGVRGEY